MLSIQSDRPRMTGPISASSSGRLLPEARTHLERSLVVRHVKAAARAGQANRLHRRRGYASSISSATTLVDAGISDRPSCLWVAACLSAHGRFNSHAAQRGDDWPAFHGNCPDTDIDAVRSTTWRLMITPNPCDKKHQLGNWSLLLGLSRRG